MLDGTVIVNHNTISHASCFCGIAPTAPNLPMTLRIYTVANVEEKSHEKSISSEGGKNCRCWRGGVSAGRVDYWVRSSIAPGTGSADEGEFLLWAAGER